MVDFNELMQLLSTPRPNGSQALKETFKALCNWLKSHQIPYRLQGFRIYPYTLELLGIWLMGSQTLLALAVWLRWEWFTLMIACASLLVVVVEVRLKTPLVSRLLHGKGENIIIELGADEPAREIIFSAHYDSKTELLDHHQRDFFMNKFRFGLGLILLLGLLGAVDGVLEASASRWANTVFYVGTMLTLPQLFLVWGLGLNFTLGRLVKPSSGAVDNGTACAMLLALAHRVALGEVAVQQTKVTVALFTGEEISMQGSRAYVAERSWPLPTIVLNLEMMGQDGAYVLWREDGSVFERYPTTPWLNVALAQVILETTGEVVEYQPGPAVTDAFSFLAAGIPATCLSTFDSEFQDAGFHRPTDSLDRVEMSRLVEGVDVLTCLLEDYENYGMFQTGK